MINRRWLKVTISRLMFGPSPIITLKNNFLKLPDNIWKVLHTDISDGIPCLFVFLWHCFGLDTYIGNKPLSWYPQIISLLRRCDYHLFQTSKLQQYIEGNWLVTTLDISMFSNIKMTTNFHVHSWELTKCELFLTCEHFLPERLLSGATMINIWLCYNW